MTDNLTPLDVCFRFYGSMERIALVARASEKSPYNWVNPTKSRDGGDFPTMRYPRRILADARKRGWPLDPVWLIEGASEDDVNQALASIGKGPLAPSLEAAE